MSERNNDSMPVRFDVAILMGSKSDWPVMKRAAQTLDELGISHEARVLSAHRTPEQTADFVRQSEAEGTKVFIAGAGAAAHLAGAVAAQTILPVIGVPLASSDLKGLDALFATVQMPSGMPVATMAIGAAGATNAALMAAAILSLERPDLREALASRRVRRADQILSEKLE
ncbi:MAG: 5-(carboxyamino)imidazole ribonucleotide mutase [Planctomycetes bacterium]|nr:5-(carboxyamino)imidazole ribonucleotide mutase [Planctomycetota bacterium]